MKPDSGEFHFLKRGQRKISAFYAKEFLFDYSTGKLDEYRRAAVEKVLTENEEVQNSLRKMKAAINYVSQLENTQITEETLRQLQNSRSYLETLVDKLHLDSWPKSVKIGLESLTVVTLMVLVLTATPWEKVSSWIGKSAQNEIILTELERHRSEADSQTENLDKKSPAGSPIVATWEESGPTYADNDKGAVIPDLKTKAEVKVKNPPPANVTQEPPEETAKAGAVGFLYRGQLIVQNLDATGEKIKQRIIELGGRKAGQVELGWKKVPNSMYFHFTIPENKKADLDEFLKTYDAKFVLTKEKHVRIMPDGIVRIIMSVDENEE